MKNKNYGFTLIELLLVVALMAISVGVTSDILVSLIRSYNKSKIINELEQNANFVTQKLTKELRNAATVTIPPTIGAVSNSIEFLSKKGDTITYSILDNMVTRTIGATSGPLTSSTAVVVTCGGSDGYCFKLIEDNPQVVKISIIMVSPDNSKAIFAGTINIEDTIVIRNTY